MSRLGVELIPPHRSGRLLKKRRWKAFTALSTSLACRTNVFLAQPFPLHLYKMGQKREYFPCTRVTGRRYSISEGVKRPVLATVNPESSATCSQDPKRVIQHFARTAPGSPTFGARLLRLLGRQKRRDKSPLFVCIVHAIC
jgi:hypothetical protein